MKFLLDTPPSYVSLACLLLFSRPRESLNVEKLKESNSYDDSSEVPAGYRALFCYTHGDWFEKEHQLVTNGKPNMSSCPGSGEGVYRTRPCNNR